MKEKTKFILTERNNYILCLEKFVCNLYTFLGPLNSPGQFTISFAGKLTKPLVIVPAAFKSFLSFNPLTPGPLSAQMSLILQLFFDKCSVVNINQPKFCWINNFYKIRKPHICVSQAFKVGNSKIKNSLEIKCVNRKSPNFE